MFNKFIWLVASILLLISSAGCSSFYPYKMEIRQGNYITLEMRSKIKVGMSRQQAMSVFGSPLVNDVFHADRWDYIYRLEEKGECVEQFRITLFFEGEFITKIDDSQYEPRAATAPVAK